MKEMNWLIVIPVTLIAYFLFWNAVYSLYKEWRDRCGEI